MRLPSAPCGSIAPWSFCERKLAAASPGTTSFLPAALAAALYAGMPTSSEYALPGRRSRSAFANGPWHELTAQPRVEKMRCWITANVSPPPQLDGGFVRVASLQSASEIALAFLPMNFPGSSLSIVVVVKIAHTRSDPMVMRTPTCCWLAVRLSGTDFADSLKSFPWRRMSPLAIDGPAGADALVYL